MLYTGNTRSFSGWEMQWLQNTLLKVNELQEKSGISNMTLFQQSVQILVKLFLRQLSDQADVWVVVFKSILLTAKLTSDSWFQWSSVANSRWTSPSDGEKLSGLVHACASSPAIHSVQETRSWDVPKLELPGYVCYGCKSGFATSWCVPTKTTSRSWRGFWSVGRWARERQRSWGLQEIYVVWELSQEFNCKATSTQSRVRKGTRNCFHALTFEPR